MAASSLIRKVLWGKKTTWQYLVASGGYATGLLIIMGSFLLYFELMHILAPEASDISQNYLIINKEVSLANTLAIKSTAFSKEDLDALKSQSFTKSISPFTASQFGAYLSAEGSMPFSTAVFFEAVESSVIDNMPTNFEWDEGSSFLPIILSQDFLNLYNFGFAPTQGLPVLSKAAFKIIPFEVNISGIGGSKKFRAKVVGFSERFPTVLVPQNFMTWANSHIAKAKTNDPKRLVLEVKDMGDPNIFSYLLSNKYNVGGEKMAASKKATAIKLATLMIAIVGFAFILLAVVAFLTSFRALVAEKREEIALLLQLGYSISAVALNLLTPFAIRLSGILALNLAIIYLLANKVEVWINGFGFETIGFFPAGSWISGVVFSIITLTANAFTVWQLVQKNFR